jgi:hypothetical protein
MPRPPLLPTIDWRKVFDSGLDYKAWLAQAGKPENRDRMESKRQAQELGAPIEAFLRALPRTVHVVAIAEDWCGDVVRHVPVLRRMEEAAPSLKVRFISREQHLDVFARFLTNGGEAIPKFVFLSEQFVECGNWGPMPAQCRELIARGKAMGDVGAARAKVSAFYEADASCRIVVEELLCAIDVASSTGL